MPIGRGKFCYVDCTETFSSGLNTGIQRVTRNIVGRLDSVDGLGGYTFVPVITMGSDIVSIQGNLSRGYWATRRCNAFLALLRNSLDGIFGVNDNKQHTPSVPPTEKGGTKEAAPTVLQHLHSGIVTLCRSVIPLLLKLPLFFDLLASGNKKIVPQQGDIYILADSFWNESCLNSAKTANAAKARVILLLYDIIPVTHPAFVDETNAAAFVRYLPQFLEFIDGAIAISKYSIDELTSYCRRNSIGRGLKSDFFHLGADFAPPSPSKEPSAELTESLGGGDFFLMVGTIEPRKNHLFVLDAMERLWDRGSAIKLCIVGKVGWKCEQIMSRVTGSAHYQKNLFFYDHLNDGDLSYCLRQSRGVIIASVVEGFGLPLIEGMYFGKTVLASDIPVFREIGGDYPTYFSLEDQSSLGEQIVRASQGELKSGTKGSWLSWDESVRVLFEKVVDMADPASPASGSGGSSVSCSR